MSSLTKKRCMSRRQIHLDLSIKHTYITVLKVQIEDTNVEKQNMSTGTYEASDLLPLFLERI